jgi:hypothetical protein
LLAPATLYVVAALTWIVRVVPFGPLIVIVLDVMAVTVPATRGWSTVTDAASSDPSAAFVPVATIAEPTFTSDREPSARPT